MPVFRDLDRLKVAIRNDVMSLIKKDASNAINEVAAKLDSIMGSTGAIGETKTTKTDKGAAIEVNVEVPVDNAVEFISKVDNVIKDTFRFGRWSDMSVN